MPVKTKFTGKCPNCCPDGGAEFIYWGPGEKRCVNCYHVLPRRTVKPSGKPTVAQQKAIDRILSVFGGSVVKQNMIGRMVWVEFYNPARSWVTGDTVYGVIGVGGRISFKMHRLGGDVEIKNDIDVNIYLKDSATRLAELRQEITTIEGFLE